MYQTSVNYGVISGLATFAFMLILYFCGLNPLGNWGWLGFWIPVLFICLGTMHQKNKIQGGFINYGQGLGLGILMTLVASFSSAVLVYVFCEFVDNSLVERNIEEAMAGMEKARDFLSDTMYEKAAEAIEQMTARDAAIGIFNSKLFGGLLVSLITAGVYRKLKPVFE